MECHITYQQELVEGEPFVVTSQMLAYDDKRIHDRSRLISLAIDARHQHFAEPRYTYQPLVGEEDENRWNEHNREHLLKNYNMRDLFI